MGKRIWRKCIFNFEIIFSCSNFELMTWMKQKITIECNLTYLRRTNYEKIVKLLEAKNKSLSGNFQIIWNSFNVRFSEWNWSILSSSLNNKNATFQILQSLLKSVVNIFWFRPMTQQILWFRRKIQFSSFSGSNFLFYSEEKYSVLLSTRLKLEWVFFD